MKATNLITFVQELAQEVANTSTDEEISRYVNREMTEVEYENIHERAFESWKIKNPQHSNI